jgi:hypothetical protein
MRQIGFLAASLLAAAPVSAQQIGVNYTNGDRNSVATQTLDLTHMAASGVRVIRFPLEKWAGSYSYSINLAIKAASYGIGTHFLVTLNNPDFYPAGTQPRPADPNNRTIWAAYPVSKLVPAQFAGIVANVLYEAAGAGAQIVAIEIGNEINNPAFNGDFPIQGALGGVTLGLSDLLSDDIPETQTLAAGFANYVQVINALPALPWPLISAGLYTPEDTSVLHPSSRRPRMRSCSTMR